jgi:hypothetical protein
VKKVDVAWLAGLFEGEGHIRLIRHQTVQLDVRMTDEDVLRRALRISGCGNVTGPYTPSQPNRKPFWVWSVGKREEVREVLEAIYPLMGSRRRARIEEARERYMQPKSPRRRDARGRLLPHA